jgi:hypothetical protein
VTKDQYKYQLKPLEIETNEAIKAEAGGMEPYFRLHDTTGYSLGAQVLWYLFAVDRFVTTFFGMIPPERRMTVSSEALFSRNLETFESLRNILDISDLSEKDFDETFSKKINGKLDHGESRLTDGERELLNQRLAGAWQILQRQGGYSQVG